MAIGQIIFAELPFACIGQPPYIERGWIKDCANKNEWDKQPTATSDWKPVVQPLILTEWEKQDRNEVNTIGCGYVPSNLGGKK